MRPIYHPIDTPVDNALWWTMAILIVGSLLFIAIHNRIEKRRRRRIAERYHLREEVRRHVASR